MATKVVLKDGVTWEVMPQAEVIRIFSADEIKTAIAGFEAEYREFADELGIPAEKLAISPFEVLADLKHLLGIERNPDGEQKIDG